MKMSLAIILAICFACIPLGLSQDPETEQQIKEAQEAAKKMGMKMPDMQKLMEESAKEDAADQASESPAATPAPTVKTASGAPLKIDIPAGNAKGSITFDNVISELKFAGAFVDQKDDRKPVVLLVSDQKLPVEKWSSEFDMMRDQAKWSGVVFFLDKEGTVYRTDVHTKGRQASVSGMFDVKLNDPTGKDLAGVAKTDVAAKDEKLDVTFHATHK
jgi:hypothetical protein